jgi:hypothetical protein
MDSFYWGSGQFISSSHRKQYVCLNLGLNVFNQAIIDLSVVFIKPVEHYFQNTTRICERQKKLLIRFLSRKMENS